MTIDQILPSYERINLLMKSLSSTNFPTESQTPRSEDSHDSDMFPLHLTTFRKTHSKMVAYMTSTMESLKKLSRTRSLRKSNKTHISILPLTREKVRVGQRGWRRRQSRGTADCSVSLRQSPSKDTIDICKSKQYSQFFGMLSLMYNKTKRGSYKLEVLLDELSAYFPKHKEKEYLKDIQEIQHYSSLVRQGLLNGGYLPYQHIKNCDGELSKLFFHICYEIYLYKTNHLNYIKLAFIHRDIQYSARRLGLLNLTLVTCLDMGRVSLDFFDFEKAQQNYSKAVKLSVFIGDKYREELAIDKLGMCQYYKGDLMAANFYHSSVDRLSAYNKQRIQEHYSNEREILKILQEKTKQKTHEEQVKQEFFRLNKENTEFNFDFTTMDSEFTQKNYDSFRTNLKDMIKVNSLRKKMPVIKSALNKVRQIGDKKYKGKDYCLPKASKFYRCNNKSQDEFMQTHRSYNRNNVGYESVKIDKHCKIIDQIMNFFQNDLRNMVKPIVQQRESMMSEQN